MSTSTSSPLVGNVYLASPIIRSAKVMQVEAMFDVPVSERAVKQWTATFPLHERHWHVGLIVGPSGSGKSSVARAVFGKQMISDYPWSKGNAVLDDFPATMATKEIIELLTSVGFSSPPAWLRPFHTLSNGEQFRVTMARALAEEG